MKGRSKPTNLHRKWKDFNARIHRLSRDGFSAHKPTHKIPKIPSIATKTCSLSFIGFFFCYSPSRTLKK
jgi:hypothetical protein